VSSAPPKNARTILSRMGCSNTSMEVFLGKNLLTFINYDKGSP
jgi:hypothetical protein